ncbi:hypothetical protein [Aminobacter sp. DSM 101952]|uniref:hypothetical protein n=1 Tax=Aminobacter sp. DSM 101952 TaxID=2735891 RepID=UPI00178E457E|nr:hypothetical protein [Aminobacter sp. DSM 101952]
MGNPVSEGVCLARSGTGNNEQGPCGTTIAMHDSGALADVQPREIIGLRCRITNGDVHPIMKHRFRFVRNGLAWLV